MKVILNKCYGGFGVSKEAYKLYCKKIGKTAYFYKDEYIGNGVVNFYRITDADFAEYNFSSFYCITKDYENKVNYHNIDKLDILYLNTEYRENTILIEVVEELGEKANGKYAQLEIVDIPNGMNYEIDDYDGIETLRPNVPTW